MCISMISEFSTFRHNVSQFLERIPPGIVRTHFVRDVRPMTSCEITFGSAFGHIGISASSCSIFVPNYFVHIF